MNVVEAVFACSIGLIGYSYVIYPVLLIVGEKILRPKSFQKGEEALSVSIIIAAYNEEKVIANRIENCLTLDYPRDKVEILIASDGSDDQTNAIVRGYAERGVKLFDLRERQGKINALNSTIKAARHDIVVFSDANTQFDDQALKHLVAGFADARIGCVCGELHFVSPDGSLSGDLEGIYWKYESIIKRAEGRRGSLLGANGAIYAIRRELFVPCLPDTIVDDFTIPMKILGKGYKVIFEPQAKAFEETPRHIEDERKRRVRIGTGDFQALFRLLPLLNPLRGFSALAFFSHKVLRWVTPVMMISTFFSNMTLAYRGLFQGLFVLQVMFYGIAILGHELNRRKKNVRLISLCYYFVSMNCALLMGLVHYLKGPQKATWQRTER